jgi:hypothetical protein
MSILALVVLLATRLGAQGWESKMISSGPNRPRLPVSRPPWRDGLIALRTGSGEIPDSVRAALTEEGVLSTGGPTCLVVTRGDGAVIEAHANEAARRFLPILRPRLDRYRQRVESAADPKYFRWDDASLLVLSDVLLDNWQINGIERDWLGAERPARAGGRYYCALFEAGGEEGLEAFGIWGNQVRTAPRWRVGVYGRDRQRPGLHNQRAATMANALGIDTTAVADSLLLQAVIDRLVAARREGAVPTPAVRALATTLGVWREGRVALTVVTAGMDSVFDAIAADTRPYLARFLQQEDPGLAALQSSMGYSSVAPAEFRIWWYHFFYSALTRELIDDGRIAADGADRVTYLTPRG